VFLFHLRSALVIALTLPLGVLLAFIVMQAQGINANIMSLGGIAIAIGAMVDAAIVMIENLHKKLERDPERDRWAAVTEAATEVGPPVFFSLLIITLSFVPVFALEGQEGRLFAPLAYTKTYAMAAAAALAVTLVPVLMGLLVRGRIRPLRENPANRAVMAAYRPLLAVALRFPRTTLLAGVLLVAATLWPASRLGTEFMPELDEGDLMYMPTTLPGLSAGKAAELLQQTDRLIAAVPEVERVFGKIGRADTATDPAPLTMIETSITLKPREEWRPGLTLEDLKRELDARVQVPGLTNAWVMPIKTRIDMLATGIKTPVGVKIAGPDLGVIEKLGRRLETLLAPIPGTASVYSERTAGGRYVTVDVDRAAAARYGMNIADVHDVVTGAVGGLDVAQAVEGLERYPINVRYARDFRDSLETLRELPVVAATGARIPLAELADIRIESGPAMIKSENARPNGWTFVDIRDRDLGAWIEEARARVAAELELPPGYSLTWAGQYEYLERAAERLRLLVPMVLAIIVVLLYLVFRRVTEVAIVLGTMPLALVGGFWLLYLLGYDLSVAVIIGFIALAGVAVEIGVLMLVYLDQALDDARESGGGRIDAGALRAAVEEGALARVRPIVMTVATILAGLAPIMAGGGTGAEIMQRIAAPMVGGIVSTMVLTLMVVPAVYLLWRRRGVPA
jgi:Cu(I)/Ag(I) efflux system membrane protein CusA/SilA